jgi:hypothetical protein
MMMMINQQERQEIRQQVKEELRLVKVQLLELQVEPIKQRKNEFYIITIRLNYPSNLLQEFLLIISIIICL